MNPHLSPTQSHGPAFALLKVNTRTNNLSKKGGRRDERLGRLSDARSLNHEGKLLDRR
jgi:hypothetical protein